MRTWFLIASGTRLIYVGKAGEGEISRAREHMAISFEGATYRVLAIHEAGTGVALALDRTDQPVGVFKYDGQ